MGFTKSGTRDVNSVFDTNILIYHLNDALPKKAFEKIQQLMANNATISVITRMEILGAPKALNQLDQAQKLMSAFTEQGLTEAIVDRVINLRQQQRIKLPDAIIAATALQLEKPLVTRNTNDFKSVIDLQLINPFLES